MGSSQAVSIKNMINTNGSTTAKSRFYNLSSVSPSKVVKFDINGYFKSLRLEKQPST
jgi:hypothetical protein